MNAKVKVNLYLDKTVLNGIDAERGNIPRSTFVNDLLYWGVLATDEQIQRMEEMMNGV